MEFDKLPEDCICTILSFTSPLDICRCSSVSTTFQSAAESDFLWDKFLPSNYLEILSASKPDFPSKKQLCLRLCCNPIFFDGNRKWFKIDKSCGKVTYMISARDLQITWSDESMHWSWLSLPESRFNEVAMLRTICWVEIQGKLEMQMLSTNTLYGAYILIKINDNAYGLDLIPFEVSIEVGNQSCTKKSIYLRNKSDSTNHRMQQLFYANRMQMLRSRVINGGEEEITSERDDGWLEIELGEFFVTDESENVTMRFTEVKGQHLKGGLVIQGIEVRPKY